MSKKVVPFRMPARAIPRPDEAQARPLETAKPEAGPAPSPRARPKAKPASASKADEWVQHREAGATGAATLGLGTPPDARLAVRGWTIDLAAERDLHEVMTMAFLIPPMLGWFWLFNIASRYLAAAR